MQKIDKVNYKNALSEKVGVSKDTKKGSVHYFDNDKIQRWYVIEEVEPKQILGYASTPEELNEKISSVNVTNKEDFEKVLKYRQVNKITESKEKDRLFYMDNLYGAKNHTLRESFKAGNKTITEDKTYEQIISELDAYPTQPGPAPAPAQATSTGAPVATQTGGAPAAPNPAIAPGFGMVDENDIMLSDIFDQILGAIKGLRNSSEDQHTKHLFHHVSECMYDTREKWIKTIKDKLMEAGQVQAMPAPQVGPQQPTPGV